MTKTISFDPGKVYEVTGIWVKDGQMAALQAYFGKIFPLASERYGVRPLFDLEPVSAYAGDFKPHIMFVNEWPSLDHFKRFVSDPEATALFPERDAAVKRLVVTQYQVPQRTSIDLADGDVVEFAGMWIKPGQDDALRSYYRDAVEIAVRHGLKPITPLAPVLSYRGAYEPDRAGLNKWGTQRNFADFASEAKPLFARRDAALDRLEVTHAFVRFDSAK